MDGIKKAKDRGVQFGKRPALNNDQIGELREKREQGALIKDLMAHYGLSKATPSIDISARTKRESKF